MVPLVEAQMISKSYICGKGLRREVRAIKVIDGVSLALNEGEMLAIMGSSGSGKTSLLYCLSGLEKPDEGLVRIRNKEITSMKQSELSKVFRKDIGFIFQSYNLIPSLNALDNVHIPARLSGASLSKKQCFGILEKVGLADRSKAMPRELSGGEQQRVAIARTIAVDHPVIFADEPTGALDSFGSLRIIELLHQVVRDRASGMIVVTHDIECASSADRVLILKDGRIQYEIKEPNRAKIFAAMERCE